jgi:NAD(P)-dependent dehydrogenase (short-subunit alcohol dehydrogenase family)
VQESVFLELKTITKAFPCVLALDNVNFSVICGEIHALCVERLAEPDEIVVITAFLCSANATMITSHNLLIGGGYTIK